MLIVSGRAPAQETAETRTLKRLDGTTLTYYITRPNADSFPIVFTVQGLKCASHIGSDASLVKALNAAVIRVEKRRFPTSAIGRPDEYLENHTIYDRVTDFKLVINSVEINETGWDQKNIYWLGGSEGGTIISLVAPLDVRAKAVVLLAPGGAGLTFAEERYIFQDPFSRYHMVTV